MKFAASAVLAFGAMTLVHGSHEDRYYDERESVHDRGRYHEGRYDERERVHVRGRASSNVISDEEIITVRAVPIEETRARSNEPRNGDVSASFCFYAADTIDETSQITTNKITCKFYLKWEVQEEQTFHGIEIEHTDDVWYTDKLCCQINHPSHYNGKVQKVRGVQMTTSGDDAVFIYSARLKDGSKTNRFFGGNYCLSKDSEDESYYYEYDLFGKTCYPGFMFGNNGKAWTSETWGESNVFKYNT
jgi:hypothetical protein